MFCTFWSVSGFFSLSEILFQKIINLKILNLNTKYFTQDRTVSPIAVASAVGCGFLSAAFFRSPTFFIFVTYLHYKKHAWNVGQAICFHRRAYSV